MSNGYRYDLATKEYGVPADILPQSVMGKITKKYAYLYLCKNDN